MVGGLVAGVPAFDGGSSSQAHLAALIASNAEMTTVNRRLRQLNRLLREQPLVAGGYPSPRPSTAGGSKASVDTCRRPRLSWWTSGRVLSKSGIARDTNHAVKAQLGFADAQRFSQSLLDAVEQVASTSLGDDCGEGFLPPNPWATAFALVAGQRDIVQWEPTRGNHP